MDVPDKSICLLANRAREGAAPGPGCPEQWLHCESRARGRGGHPAPALPDVSHPEGRQDTQRTRTARVLPLRATPIAWRVPPVLADEEAHRYQRRWAARLPVLRTGRHADLRLRELREDRHHRRAHRQEKSLPELLSPATAALRLVRAAEEDRRDDPARPALLRLPQPRPAQRRALPRMRRNAHPRVPRR